MIYVKNLTKTFNNFCAVDNMCFAVEEKQIFGFIGPNGAGKTTTIKMLATLLEPDNGTAWVGGHCVNFEPHKVRKVIGYMPDYFGVYEGVTVEEYLEFFAISYSLTRNERIRIINDCMELTDLKDLGDKMVSSLSKGMKQRLCLAKTLLNDPKVLILDEPAAGLDPRARIEFRSLLKELRDMGKTIFISSHILTELSDIVDSVAIVERGKVVITGKLKDIAKQLSANLVLNIQTFAGRDLEKAEQILIAEDKVAAITKNNESLNVEYSGKEEELYKIIKILLDADVPIIEFSKSQRNLEDIFMQVTQGDVC